MNIADILEQHALERPDLPTIEDGAQIVSYAELNARVRAAAAYLHDAGIEQGDIVAVMLPDSVEYIVLLYALAKLGAVYTAIYEGRTEHEYAQAVEGLGIKVMIARPNIAPILGAKVLAVNDIFRDTPDPSTASREMNFPATFDENRAFMAVTTSGTTGNNKRILVSHAQIMSRILAHEKYNDLKASDRYLSVLHFAFFAGSRRCMYMLYVGATVVINRAPITSQFFDYLNERKINCTFLVPSLLRELLTHAKGDKPVLPNVKILVATSRLSSAERTLIRQRLTPNLIESYGTNEAGLMTVAKPEDQDAHPESVGRLIGGLEAQVVDAEDRLLPHGQAGIIRFRGRHISTSYQINPEATARAFRDGWFYPGDLATINGEGFVFLKGRADDVINNDGAKFYPIEVESVLLAHPDVTESAVLGWPHERFGEVAVAFVVSKSKSLENKELIDFCRPRIADYKLPAIISFLSELPMNSMGKIVKGQLREQLIKHLKKHTSATHMKRKKGGVKSE